MIVVRRTKAGGAVLLEPVSRLQTLTVGKFAMEQVLPVDHNERWLRAHIKKCAKAARATGRDFAKGAVRAVLAQKG